MREIYAGIDLVFRFIVFELNLSVLELPQCFFICLQEKGHVPAMRGGRDTEMGMTILYLTKNHYINGQIITVDGGVLNVVGGN